MTVHLATDHAGFSHKELLKAHLLERGHAVVDHGAAEISENDDYPDFVIPCAQAVAKGGGPEQSEGQVVGIIFGGSGQGEAMCANRIKGVRAVVYYGGPKEILTFSKEHNNANVLSLGARFIKEEELIEIVDLWLSTQFSNDERHIRRLAKF